MANNIFITGGSGQDSKILTILLRKRKINLFVLYKKNKPQEIKGIKYIRNNLLNQTKLNKLFSKIKPNIVLHLASNNPSYYESGYETFFKENFLATKNIFEATYNSNIKAKFIFCSSSQIFKKKIGLVNENSKILKSSDYTNFRIKSDQMMLRFKNIKKIAYTNAILFNHDSIYRNNKFVIPRTMVALINKDDFFLKNIMKANICGDFSHAEDICKGLIKIMFSEKNFDKVILSSGKITHLNKIIKYVCNKNKIKIIIPRSLKKTNKALKGNNNFARKMFKWYPKKNIYTASNEIYNFLLKK